MRNESAAGAAGRHAATARLPARRRRSDRATPPRGAPRRGRRTSGPRHHWPAISAITGRGARAYSAPPHAPVGGAGEAPNPGRSTASRVETVEHLDGSRSDLGASRAARALVGLAAVGITEDQSRRRKPAARAARYASASGCGSVYGRESDSATAAFVTRPRGVQAMCEGGIARSRSSGVRSRRTSST